ACPTGTVGEEADCGWTIPQDSLGNPTNANWFCKPGQTYTFGVWDPGDCTSSTALGTARGDYVMRICDGMGPCLWHSVRRLAHSDNACGKPEPGATFTCGPTGVVTVMYRGYDPASGLPAITAADGFGPVPVTDGSFGALVEGTVISNADLGSRGVMTNKYLIDLLVP